MTLTCNLELNSANKRFTRDTSYIDDALYILYKHNLLGGTDVIDQT